MKTKVNLNVKAVGYLRESTEEQRFGCSLNETEFFWQNFTLLYHGSEFNH